MGSLAVAIVLIVLAFFFLGGDEMVKDIFKNKAEIARENRLEAEARANEARLKSGHTDKN